MDAGEAIVARNRVVEAAGGPSALSRKITALGHKITRSAISQWKKIPPERVADIEAATGIPPHEQRPDLFRRPAEAAA